MALVLYNSLSRHKEPFEPLVADRVGLYVCGVTAYDLCHLGHARTAIAFDNLVRHLRARDYRVRYIRNITDVDDKIIARAAERGEPVETLTRRMIAAMHQDYDALGLLRPDLEPRVSEYMEAILAMIGQLLEGGHAYALEGGDLYFAIRSFAGYGKLSGRSPDEMRAGARLKVDERKRDPLDFALWKSARAGEPAWDSPWGPGRPGWHIECSAMAVETLGEHFDIHGGGPDLKFPHHENEIAQSECATGGSFAARWMHTGTLQLDNEKMAKSLGNFFTVRELLEHHHPEVLRYLLSAAHYRSPSNYEPGAPADATRALGRLYAALRDVPPAASPPTDSHSPWRQQFEAAMDDDLNTPNALAALFGLATRINAGRNDPAPNAELPALSAELKALGGRLGLLQEDPEAFFHRAGTRGEDAERQRVEALIADRGRARASGDFAEADRLRDQLTDLGVTLEDGPEGTRWRWE